MPKFTPISVHDLGEYLREQRTSAQLTLRQLSAVAGISNPYLSQIERGLKKPSAEILQALAKALRISAESLYVRAGILEERPDHGGAPDLDVTSAILAEPRLNDRQRAVLLDVYESFLAEPALNKSPKASRPSPTRPVPSSRGASRPSLRNPTPAGNAAPKTTTTQAGKATHVIDATPVRGATQARAANPPTSTAPRASMALPTSMAPRASTTPLISTTSQPNTKENKS